MTTEPETDAPDRRLHVVSAALGIFVVALTQVAASALGPVLGALGMLLTASAVLGCLLVAVGLRHTPPRYGRAAFALTAIPACVTVLMLAGIALLVLALGGGNPNS